MISRRQWLGMMAAAGLSPAQDFRSTTRMIVLRVLVSDPSGRFINGLRPTDFRIFEDGIEQTVFTFAEGVRPLMPVSDDGVARRWIYPQPVRTGKSAWTESTYTITYYPDRSNLNNGFRRISIQIVPDGKGRWTVRHMPGYLP